METNRREEERKQPLFEVIQGGKEPPDTDVTWLEKLEVGACFLAKEKGNPLDFQLKLFRIGSKTPKAVVLNTPEYPTNLYVDPIGFCNKFRLWEDLGIMITPQEVIQEEQENERNREQVESGDTTGKVE